MDKGIEALIARTKNDAINGEYDGQPDVCNLIAALEREVSMREQNLSIKLHMSERIAELESQRQMAFMASNRWSDKFREAQQRISELEAAAVKPVKLPEEFSRIGENLRTQDNRVTSDPMFCVFQKREIVTHEDYDHDRIVWIDEDGNEATERQRMRLELLHENCREAPEKWRRVAVKEITDFVTCCFTEQGCKDYLACNGHNLRLPFIYVKSGFRNAEYQTVRNWLMSAGSVVGSE
jgi:hypothetical protein